MFCMKCGTKLTEDAAFCHECGSSVPIEVDADTAQTISAPTAPLTAAPLTAAPLTADPLPLDPLPAPDTQADQPVAPFAPPAAPVMHVAPPMEYAYWPAQQQESPATDSPQGKTGKKRPLLMGGIIAGAVIVILGIALSLILSGRLGGAIQHEPDINIKETLGKADAYLSEGKYDLALEQYQLVIDADPAEADAYIGAADSYVGLERIDRAVRVLEKGSNQTGSRLIRSRLSQELEALEVSLAVDLEVAEEETAGALPEPDNARLGNTNGNYMNGALAVVSGDWIYYVPFLSFDGIYKINNDGYVETQLFDDGCYQLSIADEWLYYIEYESYHIYKVRTDGTDRTLVSDSFCSGYVLYGDSIFYTNFDDNQGLSHDEPYGIYKINLDGAGKEQVYDYHATGLSAGGGWIYFHMDTGAPAKIRTDGTDFTTFGDGQFNSFVVDGGWIYYVDGTNAVYKMLPDGTEKTLVSDDIVIDWNYAGINISENWIYITNFSFYDLESNIYRIRTDGTDKTWIANENAFRINIVGDWIYYINAYDFTFYKIRTDGTDMQQIYIY